MLNSRTPLIFFALFLFSSAPSWSQEAKNSSAEETSNETATANEEAPEAEAEADSPKAASPEKAAEDKSSNETSSEDKNEPAETAAAAEPASTEAPPETEPTPEPDPAAEPAAEPPQTPQTELDEPTAAESATIAWVFAGVTLASLAGGAYAGLEAQTQFECLSDILTCNDGRDTPIENEDYLKAKADLDRLVLLADMGYLTAVVTTTVALAAVVKAMNGDGPDEATPVTSMLTMPTE